MADIDPTVTPPIEALDLIAQANALFPQVQGRYKMGRRGEQWFVTDTLRHRDTGWNVNPVTAAKKGLVSARLSANNANRKYAVGAEPVPVSALLSSEQYRELAAEAKAKNVTPAVLAAQMIGRMLDMLK